MAGIITSTTIRLGVVSGREVEASLPLDGAQRPVSRLGEHLADQLTDGRLIVGDKDQRLGPTGGLVQLAGSGGSSGTQDS